MAKGLTAQSVERLKPDPTKRLEVPDGLLPGLYLVIQPSGLRSWAVRYRHGGKPRKLTLGPYPALDLATARANAREALQAIALGRDPAREKQDAKRGAEWAEAGSLELFEGVARRFIERYARPKNRQWKRTASYLGLVPDKAEPAKANDPNAFIASEGGLAARWRGRRIADIRRAEIIAVLDDFVDSGRPVAANRVLATLRTLFNWAVERDLLPTNPCAGVRPPTAMTSRERVLSDDEIRLLWKATERQGSPFGLFVRMLLVTGQRRDEVGRMRWSEIEDDLWRLAGERTKNARAHDVPLSDLARDTLAGLPRIAGSDYIFTTTGKTPSRNYARGKARLDALMRVVAEEEGKPAPEPWRLHDLRRTVASGMARLGINLPVIEKVLNHVSGSFAGIVGVYQRHSFSDEKRQALEAWARFVLELAGEVEAQNVVPLRARS